MDARRQRYLDVEAVLAAAQADCGLVPPAAAAAIAASAWLELLDEQRLDAEQARTGHLMVPIIGELARVVGNEHGGWVHSGATTQNIQQTGDVLGTHHTVSNRRRNPLGHQRVRSGSLAAGFTAVPARTVGAR